MNKTELKQAVTKIKKFLKQRDYAAIDTGVELARGLGEPAVFEALLGGWSIDEGGRLRLGFRFAGETLTKSWSDKTWPYFAYALWNLIGYAPEGTNMDASLVRSGIRSLDLSNAPWAELPPFIAEYDNLTSLDLSECDALQNVNGLANCTQLTSLNLSGCCYVEFQNVNGLANCTQLTSLDLSLCSDLQDVDGLANCTQLTSLDLSSCDALQNVNGLANCTQLTSLDLRGCNALQNVDGLANCTQLASLALDRCDSLQSVGGLPEGIALKVTDLDLSRSSCSSLPPFVGQLVNLTHLNLSGCSSLQNLDGLPKSTELTSLDLSGLGSLMDVAGLAFLENLCSLDLSSCKQVRPRPTPMKMISRAQVAAYQVKVIRKAGLEIPDSIGGLVESQGHLGGTKKSQVIKIKKFLKQKDYGAIDTGIELARGLNDPKVFEALLGGWSIDGKGELVLDDGFAGETLIKKWSHKSWPYFAYALVSLIGYLPDGAKVDPSLVPSKVRALAVNFVLQGRWYYEETTWPRLPLGMTMFVNLTMLHLRVWKESYSGHSRHRFHSPTLQSLDGLAKCTQLTSLDLRGCLSLPNVDALSNCTQLTSLDLSYCDALQNVDALSNCTQLTSLDLSYCDALQNVDGLANCTQLTSLNLSWSDEVNPKPRESSMSTREEVANYQDKVRIFVALRDADEDALSDCKDLTCLDLSGCSGLQNVDGLANCTQLTSLDLSDCGALQNLDGLANCTQLTSLDLSRRYPGRWNDALQNVDGLANCTQLTNLDLAWCKALQDVDGLTKCTQLTSLNLYQCEALQNLDGLANCTQLTSLEIEGCRSLQNVDGLADCTQLTSLNLGGCSFLQNVDALAGCTQLTSLYLTGCEEVNPRPHEWYMTTREEVAAYQELIKASMA